jgi:SNF2 domain-containing protein
MNAPFTARVLRSYQSRAATWLYERDAAFLIAPLGAGKGAAALTALADLIRDGERRHALVIAPKLVAATVWPAEIASWPHLRHLRVAVLDGTPERRRKLLAAAPAREVTVIGVDLVQWLVGELAAVAGDHPLLDVLIIDETSRLKDPSGKRARALLKVAGRFRTRWGLTGTPRPNSSMDLFMPAAIVTNGALWGRAFVPWQKRHFRPRDPFGREWVALPGAEAKIAASFGTVAMTVADEDMPDLPPLNIIETPLQLPDAVMASYRAMARKLLTTAEGRTIARWEKCQCSAVRPVLRNRRSISRPGMRGRCRCSPFTPPRPGMASTCNTAERAWRGCRRAGRLSSPNKQSHASTGPGRRGM